MFKKFWNVVQESYRYFNEQWKKDWRKIPNVITELRFFLGLVVGMLMILSDSLIIKWIIFGLFTLVVLTDKLDGYLARKLDQITELGKVIDPVADKTSMLLVLIILSFKGLQPLLQILVMAIIFCELVVALISVIAKGLLVNWIGKTRMVIQCLAVLLLLFPIDLNPVPMGVMIIAVVINLISVCSHIYEAIQKTKM